MGKLIRLNQKRSELLAKIKIADDGGDTVALKRLQSELKAIEKEIAQQTRRRTQLRVFVSGP